jgi:hypothetical protein
MKFILILILSGFLMINLSCNSKSNVNTEQVNHDWTTMVVVLENHTVIKINNLRDTSTAKYYDNGGFFTGFHKTKVDSIKCYFTTNEKDSLFTLASEIISNPVKTKGGCTEFVGDLKLTIYYGNYMSPGSYSRSIEYSGICNIDSLSEKTLQLNKILKRKLKWNK